MKFTLKIAMDNAAFADGSAGQELAAILRDLAKRAEGQSNLSGWTRPVIDSNGNRVGELKVTGK